MWLNWAEKTILHSLVTVGVTYRYSTSEGRSTATVLLKEGVAVFLQYSLKNLGATNLRVFQTLWILRKILKYQSEIL